MRAAQTVVAMALTLAAAAAIVVVVAAPRPAHAQEITPAARQRFARGSTLYDARNYRGALEEFRGSFALYPSANAELYIARCLRELDRLAEALAAYHHALCTATTRAASDPRFVRTRDAIQSDLNALAPRVGRLSLTLRTDAADARVTVAGRELSADELSVPVPLVPGRVEVVLAARGRAPERHEVDIVAGQTAGIEVGGAASANTPANTTAIRGTAPPGSLAPPDAQTPPPPPAPVPATRVAGGVLVAVGGAAGVTFGVLAYVASSRFDALWRECGMTTCPATDANINAVAQGRTLQTIANVSLGVGVAGVAVGAVLLIVSATRREQRPPPVRAALAPHFVGVAGEF